MVECLINKMLQSHDANLERCGSGNNTVLKYLIHPQCGGFRG